MVEQIYNKLCITPSDINEHLPTLRKYAEQSSHITEFGLKEGEGRSTHALLMGKPKKLISYDIKYNNISNQIQSLANKQGTDFKFIMEDVLKASIEPTDFLFIDTIGNYNQLYQELSRHSSNVRKYIAIHDTVVYGDRDEKNGGRRGKRGLKQAIRDFLFINKYWNIVETHTNNNGLTILCNNSNIDNPSIIPETSEPRRSLVPIEMRKIIGFWHICMINNYLQIISEQLELLIKSELYEILDYVYVGCVGNEKDFEKVKNIFYKYSKLKVQFNGSTNQFEFPTIDYLKSIADNESEFFAFYFHTKGVSYPNNLGGKHWRDYMNYYIITQWKNNIIKLMEGYDTCGVKLLKDSGFPMHYSGNFWWANSSYIKTLKKIEDLKKTDRFQAEMWLCGNNPISATLCQNFVDYNTNGEFTPQKNRIIVHTLAYNLTSEVRDATKLLYEQNDKKYFEHLIVDLGFPLLDGDKIPEDIDRAKLINAQENLSTALFYNSKFMSIKNEGVSQNWNVAKKQMSVTDDDILICADPDERPKNNGWLKAISDVICYGNKIAWCSLMMKEHIPLMKSSEKKIIHGHNIYIIRGELNWAQGGFSGKFLNEIGGVPIPNGASIYGWIESACTEKMRQKGYVVAVLSDYFVEHTECSPLYRQWKTDITSNVKNGQIDFEKWLIKRKGKL